MDATTLKQLQSALRGDVTNIIDQYLLDDYRKAHRENFQEVINRLPKFAERRIETVLNSIFNFELCRST